MSNPLPREDQFLTIVSVRSGDIHVTSGTTLLVKGKTIALKCDERDGAPPSFERDQTVTLLYTHDERVLRLRAMVRDQIAPDRITATIVGEVKEGDRRDFRRADVEGRVEIRPLNAETAEDARRALRADDFAGEAVVCEASVNISGSGAQFLMDLNLAKGSFVAFSMSVPAPNEAVIKAAAQLVRSGEADDTGRRDIALRFIEISEGDQDYIVYTVFSKCFEVDESLLDDLEIQG